MTRRRVKYRDPNNRPNKLVWDITENFCFDGYFLSFSGQDRDQQRSEYTPLAIIETSEGRVKMISSNDLIFTEEPYTVIVRWYQPISDPEVHWHSRTPLSAQEVPDMKGEFIKWTCNKDNETIAIVRITEDVPLIGFKKGRVIDCRPSELHFLQ